METPEAPARWELPDPKANLATLALTVKTVLMVPSPSELPVLKATPVPKAPWVMLVSLERPCHKDCPDLLAHPDSLDSRVPLASVENQDPRAKRVFPETMPRTARAPTARTVAMARPTDGTKCDDVMFSCDDVNSEAQLDLNYVVVISSIFSPLFNSQLSVYNS
jgi:hypothetical protein